MNKEIVLLYYVFFLLAYLVIKSIIFWKKYNVNPASFMKEKNKENMWWHGLALTFGTYILFFILFYFGKIGLFFDDRILDISGFIVLFFGFFIMVLAHAHMGTSWRMGNDSNTKTKLVYTGLFGHSRNPVYLALIIQSLGVLMIVPHILTLILFIAIIVIFNFIVKSEEKFLEKQFGEEFLKYKTRVRRFI